MKVLVLHSELGVLRGGGENFTRNLFTAFARRGHMVHAAFVSDPWGKYPFAMPEEIKPIQVPGWWSRNLGQHTLCALRCYVPARKSFQTRWDRLQEAISWRTIRWHDRRFQRRILRDFNGIWNNFDVAYVHSSTMLASKVARHVPTVLRLPGPIGENLTPALRQVHVVCANGDALLRIRGFLGEHAQELPIGIDARNFHPGGGSIRAEIGWTAGDRVIGYVGRLTHLKGTDLLVSAFAKMSTSSPSMKLLVVGGGSEEPYLRSILAKQISRGSVYIQHDLNHAELPSWYRAMDLFVMPSRYENLSNAVLEAMACGIPFLASDVGGNRILANSEGGWLFSTASLPSLIGQLQTVLKNDAELKNRGKLGSRYVRQCCSWMASAERLEEIIAAQLKQYMNDSG